MVRLNNFLIADLENTGVNPMASELLTGSFIYCDSELNVLDIYELESRPRKWDKEAEESVAIHGIDHATAMRFMPFQNAMAGLTAWPDTLEPSHFVCHANRMAGNFRDDRPKAGWSTFDWAFLLAALLDYGAHDKLYRAAPCKSILSTHSLAKYLRLPCEYNLKAIAVYLKLLIPGAKPDLFFLPNGTAFNHHDAAADAILCYDILKILLPQINLEEFLDFENFKIRKEEENEEESTKLAGKQSKKRAGTIPGNSNRLL